MTTLNCERPDGELLPLQDVDIMLNIIDAEGNRLLVERGVRKAGLARAFTCINMEVSPVLLRAPSPTLRREWSPCCSRQARARTCRRPMTSNKATFKMGDVLYRKLRPYLNKVTVADDIGSCSTEIVPIRPKPGLTPEWLKLCLRRPCFLQYADAKSYGMKMPRLGTKDAKASRHPVPPKAEQGRIIQ